jgi:hypothetical protein
MERRGMVIEEYDEVVTQEEERPKEEKTFMRDADEIPLPEDLKLP